jgi:ABC-type uncharacterized transport system auxiliary subunit
MLWQKALLMRIFTLATLATLAVCAGCSSLLTAEAPPSYHYLLARPPSPAAAEIRQNPDKPSLYVQIGSVGIGLASDRVMARDQQRLAPIKQLRWAEPSADLLEKTLVRQLELSGHFSYVTSQRGGPPTDLTLVIDLRSLYVHLNNQIPESADVALSARLVNRLQKKPLGIAVLAENEAIAGSDPASIIMAFQRASARVLSNLDNTLAQALASQ